MATEYIEKAGLMSLIESEAHRWGDDYDWWQCLADIEDFKPADVRPVVLCGDCCWFTDTGFPDPDPDMPELRMGLCLNLGRDVQACWFCATGEREGGESGG